MKTTDGHEHNFQALLEQLAELEARRPSWSPPYTAFKAYRKELREFLSRICGEYLNATPEQTEQIRNAVCSYSSVPDSLTGLLQNSADQLRASKDLQWLRIGLAAASLENGRTDFRDVFLALAELYVAAEEVGIDPQPYFQTIAQLSSDAPLPPEGISIRKRLAEFHTYAVLRERKGEITEEERRATEEQVKKWFDDRLMQIQQQSTPWWKRIFGRQ